MKGTSRKLIHRCHWNNHLVEIFDTGGERSLYFSGNILQSTMSLFQPHNLVLSYTHYMMATLLFNNTPEKVLLIGVGAGSLLRFLHHHFPLCHIDAIDKSQLVIDLARKYFAIPESEQIKLRCCDGFDFLSMTNRTKYDLILVDAFDQSGMSPTIYAADFFERCSSHLEKDGLISLNIWSGNEEKMKKVTDDLHHFFGSVLKLPVPNRGNIICIVAQEKNLALTIEQDHQELLQLNKKMQINFKKILKVCAKHNFGFKERVARFFI